MYETIIVERTWEVNGLLITKSWLFNTLTKKKYDCVYSVEEIDGDNLNCFKTLKEAKDYAKNY